MASRPLFELFVKISEKGLDDLDKKLAAKEKQLQAAEERWDDFADKKFPKQIKGINKELDKVSKTFEKITKSQDEWNKSSQDGAKKNIKNLKDQDTALGKLADSLDRVRKTQDDINKKGISLTADTKGLDDAEGSLRRLIDARDELMKNNKITLEIELRGGADVLKELEEIEGVKSRLDGETIHLQVDADTETAHQKLEEIKREANDLEAEVVNVNVDADTVAAEDGLRSVRDQAIELEGVDPTINVDADTGAAEANLLDIQSMVSALDAYDPTINVDADTAAAEANLGLLEAEVISLDAQDINIDVNVDRDGAGRAALGAIASGAGNATTQVGFLNDIFAAGGTLLSRWGALAGIATLAVEALAGAVTPLLGGVATLGSVVTGAAAGFGLLAGAAIPVIQGLKEIDKANEKVKTATLNLSAAEEQLQQAYASGDEAAIAAARSQVESATKALDKAEAQLTATTEAQGAAVTTLYDKWQTLKSALADAFKPASETLAQLGSQILDVAQNAVPALGTAASQVASSFSTAMTDMLTRIQENETAMGSFQTILDGTSSIVASLTTAVGDFGTAFLNIMAQAMPSAQQLADSIADVAARFLEWTQSEEGIRQINAALDAGNKIFYELVPAVAEFAGKILELGVEYGPQVVDALTFIVDTLTYLQTEINTTADELAPFVAFLKEVYEWGQSVADGLNSALEAVQGFGDTVRGVLDGLIPDIFSSGSEAGEAYADGVESASGSASSAGSTVGSSAASGASSTQPAMGQAGESTGSAYAKGVELSSGSASSAGSSLGESAASGATESQGAMGQAGESTGDAYAKGVELGMSPAKETAATESQATADATKQGLSSIPGTVEQIMSGIPEETLIAWQNATAYAANATAEMTRVITHNLEAIDNNVQVILGQATESIQTKMDEMAAAAQTGIDAVNAVFESGFSVTISDYITPMIDEGIAEFDRFSSEGPAALQVGIDAITEALNTLYTDSLASYITPMVDEIVTELERLASEAQTTVDTMATDLNTSFSTLQTDISTTITTLVTDVTTQLTDMSTQVSTIITDLSTQITTALTDMSTQINTIVTDMATQVTTAITDMATQINTTFTDLVTQVQDLWQQLYEKLVELTTNLYNELTRIIGDMATWIEQRIGNMINAITSIWSSWTQFLISSSATAATSVVSNFGNMAVGVETYVQQMIAAIQRLNAAMNSIGGMRTGGIIAGAIGRGISPILGRAKGGVDDNVEAQGGTGGVSSGIAPRVVYGEQQRRTREAYIVEDRPDNLPYLAEAASWFNMQLVPGMATGGLISQIGSLWKDVPHIPPPETTSTASGTGSTAGSTAGTTGEKKPSRRQRRRQRKRDRRQQRSSARGTARSTSTGSTPTSTSSGSTPSMGSTPDTGAMSPSQSAFPSNCGQLYPVGTPTEAGQVPYRDSALQQSGMLPVAAAGSSVGADHVNAPAEGFKPGDAGSCGVGGSGSPAPMPMPSTTLGGPGTTPSSFDTCLPAHVTGYQTGGTTTDPSTGQAVPLDWFETPLGYWDSGLGYGWYADPSLDFPTIYPPAGWDPSVWYYTPSQSGMARGGILKNGTRHFQAGGLNTYQLAAGQAAGESALGSFYSYGSAGIDGGFDCSGLWQYIYTAVIDGAPTPDYRYLDTYTWEGGVSGTTPGNIPGAMNVGVDTGYQGAGALSADGTHMYGDIMNELFESDSYYGVSNGASSGPASNGITQWTLGDPADIGNWGGVTSDYAVDPSAMMGQEVSSWWLCQAPTAPDIGAAPMFGPVEEWMSSLPGMTEPFLQQAGQEAIGTLGSGTAGGGGTTTTDYIISALESLGMDTTSDAIASLEALIACESSGDPSATSPDGAMGLTQLMPDTWAQFGIGGDPYDPIANIAASINYQLSRYQGLVDFCPYERGGFAMGPQLQLKGESSRELTVPLDDRSMAAVAQRSLGIEGMAGAFEQGFNHLSERIDNVAQRVDHQTGALPGPIASAMDNRIRSNPQTNQAINTNREADAMVRIFRGETR